MWKYSEQGKIVLISPYLSCFAFKKIYAYIKTHMHMDWLLQEALDMNTYLQLSVEF